MEDGGWTVPTRPGTELLPPSPPKGGEGDGENNKGGEGEAYRTDAEKGWQDGQTGKDNGMD